jgi:hypothetical protein
MDEQEWLESDDPTKMLRCLQSRDKLTDRQNHLFAVACCRRIWDLLPRDCARWKGDPGLYYRAVETAERYAEGLATREEVEATSIGTSGDHACDAFAVTGQLDRWEDALSTVSIWASAAVPPNTETVLIPWEAESGPAGPTQRAEQVAHCELLRCIFGNPFQPVSLDPAWRTPTVSSLAHAAYDNRLLPSGELEPARLAVLADALEEAGCTEAAILDHLRGPGPHMRGCWVVDVVLGKQ